MKKLLRILYPPLCVYCSSLQENNHSFFCPACLDLLALIDPEGRCRVCFLELGKGPCKRCQRRATVIRRQFAAVESVGPAKTLLQFVQEGDKKAIEAAAALMAYQYLKREPQLPDIIVPLPVSFGKRWTGQGDCNSALSESLGEILGIPAISLLRRRWDWQHFLKTGELLPYFTYKQQKRDTHADKRILLCAAVLDDTLFRRSAFALRAIFPSQIEGLAYSDVP